ncbi:hypothetical protein RCM66_04345 [Escherichia coli]|uniref:hypothetical protein n=1 Tax=Escherichia coli TaxID=562 RepID=UPI000D09DA49|nr:hypothetical protein [Escherichia coli]EKK2771026.1 hypothetical protein [Escherichia coli]MED9212636.1 hypothetical protein [Escherichia coli]
MQKNFDWALAQQASTLNLKLQAIFHEYCPIVDNALIKIGYHFHLMSLSHKPVWQSGNALILNS